jgi:LPS sulfotransferase NodH
VHVDIDAFLRRAAEIDAEGTELGSLLSNQAVLDISYEELAADTSTTVARVCQFLGLESVPSGIKPALDKVGAADLRNSVSNFQDLLDNPATRTLALTD